MNRDDIDSFLNQRFVGALATLQDDGSPRVIPIWYRWTGTEIKIWSDSDFGWVKRLASESRVAFTVFEHEVPRRAVYIRGTASVVAGPMAGDLLTEMTAITARYVGPEVVDTQVKSYDHGIDKVIVTITPDHVRGLVNS